MIEQPDELNEAGSDASIPARLGFNEIVPGMSPEGQHRPQPDPGPVIPEFNLDQQMMAQHRRSIASRRRGPGQQTHPAAEPVSQTPVQGLASVPATWRSVPAPGHDPIIAEIVARDLARLCGRKWRPSELD